MHKECCKKNVSIIVLYAFSVASGLAFERIRSNILLMQCQVMVKIDTRIFITVA